MTPYIGTTAQSSTTVGNVTSTLISPLSNGTSYTFRVAAINAIGTGNQSADSNAVTPTTIVFRASSVGQTRGNKGSVALELAKPVGAAVGDVLIASIDLRGAANVSPPTTTTWTLVEPKRTAGSGNDALQKSTYWHTVTAGDPAMYSWSFSAVSNAVGSLVAYGGVDTSSFVANSQANAAATAVVAPTVIAGTAGSRLVGFFTTATNATFTPPAGMAERCEIVNSGSVKFASEATDSALGGIGPTGARTATASKSAVSIGQLVVLRPLP